jgi:hypothetical protein
MIIAAARPQAGGALQLLDYVLDVVHPETVARRHRQDRVQGRHKVKVSAGCETVVDDTPALAPAPERLRDSSGTHVARV